MESLEKSVFASLHCCGFKYLNERVVQDEHDGGKPPSPLAVPKEHLTDIGDIFDLGMTETELPGVYSVQCIILKNESLMAYQTIKDVYSTKPATTTVKISPGTRPSTEYEYGKDMIARQMYSEKSSAAVCVINVRGRIQELRSCCQSVWLSKAATNY